MHVAFRVDASPEIGAGHLMRCLTLANALREQGVQSRFYCASLPPSLAQLLAQHAHHVVRLDGLLGFVTPANAGGSHEREQADAAVFLKAASGAFYDWVVVDHYQLAAT